MKFYILAITLWLTLSLNCAMNFLPDDRELDGWEYFELIFISLVGGPAIVLGMALGGILENLMGGDSNGFKKY